MFGRRERGLAGTADPVRTTAPPTVLRRSGFFGADNGHENSEQEQQKPHGDLLMTPIYSLHRDTLLIMRDEARGLR
jgi:hypothetical protein